MITKIIVVFFSFFCSVLCYFLLLHLTIINYQTEKNNTNIQQDDLRAKKALVKLDAQNKMLLSHWKQKHPHLYATAQLQQTPDQLLQQVAQLAQQTGLMIVEAAPKEKIFQLTLSGNYLALFDFIKKVNADPFPITLIQLKISKAGQFVCEFSRDVDLSRLMSVNTLSVNANILTPIRDPFLHYSTVLPSITASITSKPLHSCWISLYFAQADNVAAFISKKSSGILSPQGKINFDKRSNQIWLEDDAPHLTKIRQLIQHLDKPALQFLIKAKVINLDRHYQKTLGVLFQTNNTASKPPASLPMNQSQPIEDAGEFTVAIAKLAQNHLLNLQISALEQEGHATLISNPELMTLENQPAIIQSGAEVPYQEATSSGATSVSFKKAVLRLKVTPQRMPHNHILLHIELNQDKVSDLTVNGVPAIQTQQITTQVVMKNNQTIVLGGILETSRTKQRQGIPVIDDIPLIGELFQNHQKLTKQQELLIFITPTMMKALS